MRIKLKLKEEERKISLHFGDSRDFFKSIQEEIEDLLVTIDLNRFGKIIGIELLGLEFKSPKNNDKNMPNLPRNKNA